MTKEAMRNSYERANEYDIFDAYGRPSVYKARAWEAIRRECYENGGSGLVITGHNSSFFSCAYVYPDPDTGALRLVFHTYANRYEFDY